MTFLETSSACSSSSSSSSGSLPVEKPRLRAILLSPPSQNPLEPGERGSERGSGGRERERRASLAEKEDDDVITEEKCECKERGKIEVKKKR